MKKATHRDGQPVQPRSILEYSAAIPAIGIISKFDSIKFPRYGGPGYAKYNIPLYMILWHSKDDKPRLDGSYEAVFNVSWPERR